jgi:hypothetical protein
MTRNRGSDCGCRHEAAIDASLRATPARPLPHKPFVWPRSNASYYAGAFRPGRSHGLADDTLLQKAFGVDIPYIDPHAMVGPPSPLWNICCCSARGIKLEVLKVGRRFNADAAADFKVTVFLRGSSGEPCDCKLDWIETASFRRTRDPIADPQVRNAPPLTPVNMVNGPEGAAVLGVALGGKIPCCDPLGCEWQFTDQPRIPPDAYLEIEIVVSSCKHPLCAKQAPHKLRLLLTGTTLRGPGNTVFLPGLHVEPRIDGVNFWPL